MPVVEIKFGQSRQHARGSLHVDATDGHAGMHEHVVAQFRIGNTDQADAAAHASKLHNGRREGRFTFLPSHDFSRYR